MRGGTQPKKVHGGEGQRFLRDTYALDGLLVGGLARSKVGKNLVHLAEEHADLLESFLAASEAADGSDLRGELDLVGVGAGLKLGEDGVDLGEEALDSGHGALVALLDGLDGDGDLLDLGEDLLDDLGGASKELLHLL
jgi:hypothetical protein